MPQSCAVGCSNRAEKRAQEGYTGLVLYIHFQRNEVIPPRQVACQHRGGGIHSLRFEKNMSRTS